VRVDLFKLLLRQAENLTFVAKNDGPARGCALVESEDEFFAYAHQRLKPTSLKSDIGTPEGVP
jgi:hypothetical protein